MGSREKKPTNWRAWIVGILIALVVVVCLQNSQTVSVEVLFASFDAKGYDCSGAVSYALHGANLLSYTQVSGQLAHYGSPGPGRWITIYANAEHVFMVVAGLRFDTRNDPEHVSGPRWKMAAPEPTILPKFAVRHLAGY